MTSSVMDISSSRVKDSGQPEPVEGKTKIRPSAWGIKCFILYLIVQHPMLSVYCIVTRCRSSLHNNG